MIDFQTFLPVGTVNIGLGPGNESEYFSYNENEQSGSIPVFMQLVNGSEALPVYDGNVG